MCLVAEILQRRFPLPDTNCDTRKTGSGTQRGIELPRRNILCPSLGRSRLNVDSMNSLAEANQKFVRDSTGLLCNLLRAEDMAAARPVDQNLAE